MAEKAHSRTARIVATLAIAGMLVGCATLPPQGDRVASTAVSGTADTRVGRAIAPQLAAHPGISGIHPLVKPRDAFVARAVLAAAADKSLDVQYYIWHGDEVGLLLFEALWNAADRGVRVRLLLDDNNTKGLDPTIATLDGHPNIEVRLYNPFLHRTARSVDYLSDFARLNRRMHNKSFTADGQVAVIGGRNIGDEYFGAGEGVVFADVDVIAIGPAVSEISRQFDRYWNSASAYPAAKLLGPPADDGAARLQARFAENRVAPASVEYAESLKSTPLLRDLLAQQLVFEWSNAQLVADDPAKTLDTEARTDILLFPDLVRRIGVPKSSLDLISPYFVPGDEGTAVLASLARSGVKIRILTNSLAASDVSAVHAGYAKRRKDLLAAGVELFELKPTAGASNDDRSGLGSSSSAGLHAKTFAVDQSRVFVGSFNFDPRSAKLNTEMGLVIESAKLARELAAEFDARIPGAAFQVRLAADGRLQWIERTQGGEKVYETEPGAGLAKRLGVGVLSVLPIEWML
jgi:putative cardiolipin synthase